MEESPSIVPEEPPPLELPPVDMAILEQIIDLGFSEVCTISLTLCKLLKRFNRDKDYFLNLPFSNEEVQSGSSHTEIVFHCFCSRFAHGKRS